MKKIFLLLWFVLLGLSKVQAYEFEKNGIYYDIVNGKAVVVSGDVSYSGDVVIPDSVEYDDVYLEVDSISEYAFQKSESLSSIVLPKSLTSIGESAFSGCSGLVSIVLPKSLTSIGESAFSGCSGLDSISLPEGLTSVESHSFNCCTNLKSVSFPEGLTSIGFGAFNRCGNLTSLVFPASLTSISDNAFNWCSNVDTLSFLGRMDSINWNAFTDGNSANQNIKRVYINDLSTWLNSQRYIDIKIVGYEALSAPEAVLYLDGKLLTDMVVPEGVKEIKPYTFYGMDSIRSVTLPKTLKNIAKSAFENCVSLTSVAFPEGLTGIEDAAFYGCDKLDSLSFSASMKTINWTAFCTHRGNYGDSCSCEHIRYVDVEDLHTWINSVRYLEPEYGSSHLYFPKAHLYMGGKLLTHVVIPGDVTEVKPYTFSGMDSIRTVSMQKGVENVGKLAFSGCLNLSSLSFSEGLKEISSYAFENCASLSSVSFSEGLEKIGSYAFENCGSLTSVAFPEGLTEIEERTFYGCDKLDSLSFPASMKAINWTAFCTYRGNFDDSCSCEHIRYVDVKDLHTWINSVRYVKLEYGSPHLYFPKAHLYMGGKLLTHAVIPGDIAEIKPYTFSRMDSIRTVSMQKGVENVGKLAFSGCRNLSSVTFSEGFEEIGERAFTGCDSLHSVKLPASIKELGSFAFNDQGVEIELYALVPPVGGSSSLGDNLVYVPESCIEAYRTAWSDKVNDILCLERQHDWDVMVEAEEKSSAVLQAVGGVSDNEAARNVVRLKVSGTVNSYDFMVMRNKMTSLRELDLADAHVVYNPYEHYQGYHSWNDSLPDYAFYRKDLRECKLPQSITYIGQSAFSECRKLTGMDIPEKVQEIGYAAFTGCNCLKEVEFHEGLERIGSEGFFNCALQDTIVFPQTLKHISYNAFGMNGSLKAVKFPVGLEYIESSAFGSCYGLSEVRFPASVLSVGSDAFRDCGNIKDVYTYIIDPLQLDQTTFSAEVFKNATLHVPETAQNNYYWDTQWSQFPSIVMFNEPYEYFYLNKDLVIDEETPRLEGDTISGTGEVQGPDADLNPGSGLVVEGSESQDLGDVHLKDDGNGNGASVIGQGDKDGHCNINAKNLHIDIQVEANRWYFFCFPYPIDKKNIKYDGSYVLRWYDGAERAQHGRGGWKDWAAGKLTAGVGYIFQGSQSGTLTFQVPDAKFDGENRDILLQSHGADEVQDAGWNFVGNPYTSYFDLQDLGYDYPVTIWNGWSYEAYNPQDDDYVLYPYQAFFVQKPNAEDGITFHAAHRKTKLQSEAARRANVAPRRMRRAAGVERRLVNLTLSDGKVTDKTRVVFNARKRETYEVGCDAAKFMAEGVPQLYSLDGQGVKYAINERPEGNGVVSLGYEVQAAGNYTIGLTRADVGVMLKDKLTGASHDFSEGDYVFSSEAGTFHDRFLLVKSASATGVNGVFAAGEAVVDVENGTIAVSGADGLRTTVTALSGILMGIIDGNGSLDVRPGVYVVNVGGQARKVVVR